MGLAWVKIDNSGTEFTITCQGPWAKEYPGSWLDIISGCVCEGISGGDSHLNWWKS